MKGNNNNSSQLYLWGALIGLGLGLVSAHLYGRAVEESSEGKNLPANLSAGDSVKLGLLLLGIVRQVADFGSNVGKPDPK